METINCYSKNDSVHLKNSEFGIQQIKNGKVVHLYFDFQTLSKAVGKQVIEVLMKTGEYEGPRLKNN